MLTTPSWLLLLMVLGIQSPQGKTLRVGQEWAFEGRPTDPQPTLVVDRIERVKSIDVVHVTVRGVRIRNPGAPGGYSEELQHLPVAIEAVQRSITTLVHDSVAIPAYEEGYKEWQRAGGGVWSVPLRAILDAVEKTVR